MGSCVEGLDHFLKSLKEECPKAKVKRKGGGYFGPDVKVLEQDGAVAYRKAVFGMLHDGNGWRSYSAAALVKLCQVLASSASVPAQASDVPADPASLLLLLLTRYERWRVPSHTGDVAENETTVQANSSHPAAATTTTTTAAAVSSSSSPENTQ